MLSKATEENCMSSIRHLLGKVVLVYRVVHEQFWKNLVNHVMNSLGDFTTESV